MPKILRKKTDKRLNDLVTKGENDIIKMKVIAAGGNKVDMEMMVNVVLNSEKTASGVIITSKK